MSLNIYLEVDHYTEDEDGGEEIHQVGEVLPVEGLAEGPDLVLSGGEQVEQCDHGALELGAAAGVDGGGGEGLPDDGLADVGGDKQRNSRAKTWGGKLVKSSILLPDLSYRILSAGARPTGGQSDQQQTAG